MYHFSFLIFLGKNTLFLEQHLSPPSDWLSFCTVSLLIYDSTYKRFQVLVFHEPYYYDIFIAYTETEYYGKLNNTSTITNNSSDYLDGRFFLSWIFFSNHFQRSISYYVCKIKTKSFFYLCTHNLSI